MTDHLLSIPQELRNMVYEETLACPREVNPGVRPELLAVCKQLREEILDVSWAPITIDAKLLDPSAPPSTEAVSSMKCDNSSYCLKHAISIEIRHQLTVQRDDNITREADRVWQTKLWHIHRRQHDAILESDISLPQYASIVEMSRSRPVLKPYSHENRVQKRIFKDVEKGRAGDKGKGMRSGNDVNLVAIVDKSESMQLDVTGLLGNVAG